MFSLTWVAKSSREWRESSKSRWTSFNWFWYFFSCFKPSSLIRFAWSSWLSRSLMSPSNWRLAAAADWRTFRSSSSSCSSSRSYGRFFAFRIKFQTEAYLAPSQISMTKLFLEKSFTAFSRSIFTWNLHRRCLTGS